MRLGLFVSPSVCLSVRTRNSKTIATIDSIFYTINSMPVARSSSSSSDTVSFQIGSRSELKNIFNDSSPSGDRTKYATKVRHDVKRAL